MHLHAIDEKPGHAGGGYLVRPAQAWFAFAMTFGLMLFDYIDRQVIVSLFPYLKAEWALSDKQLGGLVSVISVVVAMGAIPVALLADRFSRVRSVVVMGSLWSVATISCMFCGNYTQLFAARAMVGVGETGYGSVGAALIASLFPARLRSALLGAFFAAASLGSVLGVLLGGVIAARWGWKAAFGAVGLPGLVLALAYLAVRDYRTVPLTPRLERATESAVSVVRHIAGTLFRSRTMLWACLGGAMQLVVVSAVWSWLPSLLNRVHTVAPDMAGKQAALVVLAGALGSFVWGSVVDRLAQRRLRNKLVAVAVLCLVAMVLLAYAFGAAPYTQQLGWIIAGGFVMTCSVGPIASVVIDVVHPSVRSTGAAVLSLFQNLLGMALGPFLAGLLSDSFGLTTALGLITGFGAVAAVLFIKAAASYESDVAALATVQVTAADGPARLPADPATA
jgi:MFS transporter, Spinster family, sphingosine-1-phosphate transporter